MRASDIESAQPQPLSSVSAAPVPAANRTLESQLHASPVEAIAALPTWVGATRNEEGIARVAVILSSCATSSTRAQILYRNSTAADMWASCATVEDPDPHASMYRKRFRFFPALSFVSPPKIFLPDTKNILILMK
jgi:hypothetical protein